MKNYFFCFHQTHCLRCDSRSYRGASARREFKHASAPAKKRRGASEIPPPRHARLDHSPVRRRPQAAGHAGLLVGFNSRSTPVGAVSHVAPGLLRPGSTRG